MAARGVVPASWFKTPRKSALLTMSTVARLYPEMLQRRVRGTILAAPEDVGRGRFYFSSASILSASAGVTGL